MADLNVESLSKLRVVDLREHLSSRGLPTSGLKADLVKRLREALENEQSGGNSEEHMNVSYDITADAVDDIENEASDNKAESPDSDDVEMISEEQVQFEKEQEKHAEEERQRMEQEKQAEEERQRIEQEKQAEEERQRMEQEKQAEEERLQLERERKAEEERIQMEQERKAEMERQQIEQERKIEEERKRIIQERKAEEERQRIEQERKAEERRRRIEQERKAEEERQRIEQERKAEEERQRIEQERKAEEERQRIEQAKIAEEERQRIDQERRAKEERLRMERERLAEEERQRMEQKKQRLEQERRAEEKRLRLEQERRAEEEKLRIEQARWAEEERQRIERERKAEEERLQIEREKERQRIEQERKAEEERLRLQIEQKRKEEEEKLRIEQERKAEEERLRIEAEKRETERRKEEENRIAAAKERRMAEELEMQKEQERWLVEEQMKRAQDEHKKRLQQEEQKRVLEEQQRLMEEELEKQKKEQVYQLQQRTIVKQENQSEFNTHADMNLNSLQTNSTYVSIPSTINIIPPPPTVLMSNIPPPPTMIPSSHVSMSPIIQVSTPPTMFPTPPPVNITAPSTPVQSFVNELGKEMNSLPTVEIISESEALESMDTSENIPTSEIKLPQALEKVLALKTERAQQLGIDPDAVVQPIPISEEKISASGKSNVVTLVSVDEDEYAEEEEKNKKNAKSRRRKKKKKKHHNVQIKNEINKRSDNLKSKEISVDTDIEYVQEVIDISDPMYAQFMKIFEKFKLTESEKEKDETLPDAKKEANKEETLNPMAFRKKPIDLDDDDDDEDPEDKKEEEKPKLSKRKLKKLSRMTVAELKQKVNRPELVEMHDVTAKDPVLLLHLKASRNTVPVPRHWCFKRKYLQGKRGIEKPAFELPDFIKRTGIMEMRQALQEKEDQKTMKAKMRERVRPKLGKIDIDYQKLHDAFFKWQTKPRMTIHGDLYYEGKEFETRLKEKKPGDLSDDLRTALGMPTGPNANKCPPPWLIAMQRYGPPPSYPNLKIPGLNAPIPDSCSFGYHAGGWGKPPVDETGRPLYGDVFGTQIADNLPNIQEEEIDHTLWGELESESSEEEEEEEDEEEEEEEEKQEDETGLVTPAEGLITPSGFSSIPAGMETPDMIELRKRKIEAEKEGGETPALYTILPEKKNERVGAAMMGSTHTYDLAAAIPASKLKIPGTTSVPPQGIEVALDPSELEMDSAAMAARYEQTMREQQSQLEKEDLSDMVAEHAARQKNKRKKQQLDSAKPPKKYKEFKF